MKSRHSTSPEILRAALTRIPLPLAAVVSLATAGCVLGPNTGKTFPDTTTGFSMVFAGRSDTPNAQVTAYVLANASDDPLTGTYVSIGSTVGEGGAGHDGNDVKPYYDWSFNSNGLNAAQWPQGGLARFKVKGWQNDTQILSDMVTFDTAGFDCAVAGMNDPWLNVGEECQSPYGAQAGIITVVSTTPTPAEVHPDILYLGRGAQHRYLSDVPVEHKPDTDAYYAEINAPQTLTAFRQKYHFSRTSETRAVYYNNGDLGVGRDMHCAKYTPPFLQTVTACYVTNYGREPLPSNLPVFGLLDAQVVLDDMIAALSGENLDRNIATVAMVYDPSKPVDENRVQFVVYDGEGNLTQYAALDNHGAASAKTVEQQENVPPVPPATPHATTANITVPDNCLACHGLSATYERASDGPGVVPAIANAAFLPFDEEAMVFSATSTTYSAANMRPKLKKLNAMVYDTAPPAAVITLLNGMYKNPQGVSVNGPKDTDTTFQDDYVPAGWNTTEAANRVYTEVVKPYCRTCHVTASTASGAFPGLEWSSWDQFSNPSWAGSINGAVCESSGPMPHSEQAQTKFWQSPARAILVNALGLQTDCAP